MLNINDHETCDLFVWTWFWIYLNNEGVPGIGVGSWWLEFPRHTSDLPSAVNDIRLKINILVLKLILVWYFDNFPVPGVSCSWLVHITPDLHASLFWQSISSRLKTLTSALTHSLGHPHPLGAGMAIPAIEFVQVDARATWPYHLRRLVLNATATFWIPYYVYRVPMGTSSCGFIPQIQRIGALSFLRRLCNSGAIGAQVSLPLFSIFLRQPV